jgi:hypothetical protein
MGMPSNDPAMNPMRMRWMLAERCSSNTPLRTSTTAFLNTTVGGGNSTELTT